MVRFARSSPVGLAVSNALPLAAAAERLRGVPGFPRRRGRPRKNGDNHGDVSAAGAAQPRGPKGPDSGPDGRALATHAAVIPRLLTVEQAAEYLALGVDTVYGLVSQGVLRRVRIPGGPAGEL